MKLSRLLVLIISLLWLLIFIGTLAISIHNTRDYLVNQMRSHAQDTATSLGLSLTSSVEQGDLATMKAMVDAIFDRGYYREIAIREMSGDAFVERAEEVWVKGVPAWFIDAFELDAPQGKALIMHGWKQVGTVEVVSHPGYAYKELWRVSVQAFGLLAAAGLASFLLVVLVLRSALAPLAEMESQALAVSERQFRQLKKIPWARELRRVAAAMNTMCLAVERMLSEQSALTERMRVKAYQDGVTGLANGRSFGERLHHLVSSPEEFSAGALVLVCLERFKEYNEQYGHAAGNRLLQTAAQVLVKVGANYERCLLARMNGAEFAMLAPDIGPDKARALGDALVGALAQVREQAGEEGVEAYVGIACYQAGQSTSDLLCAADMALEAAQDRQGGRWRLYSGEGAAEKFMSTDGARKDVVEKALATGGIMLAFQPVLAAGDQRLLHYEALARIPTDDGALLPAGMFMPIARRHGLAEKVDRQVVAKVLAHLESHAGGSEMFAVNLSGASVRNPDFVGWLCTRLLENRSRAGRLLFEVAELGIMDDVPAMRSAIEHIRHAGARFALDCFGLSAASLGHLRNLHLEYVKIDGSYIRHIDQNEDSQFFVQALAGIAHGLGMSVIAEYVETRGELETLQRLAVDGVQGYFVGEPKLAG